MARATIPAATLRHPQWIRAMLSDGWASTTGTQSATVSPRTRSLCSVARASASPLNPPVRVTRTFVSCLRRIRAAEAKSKPVARLRRSRLRRRLAGVSPVRLPKLRLQHDPVLTPPERQLSPAPTCEGHGSGGAIHAIFSPSGLDGVGEGLTTGPVFPFLSEAGDQARNHAYADQTEASRGLAGRQDRWLCAGGTAPPLDGPDRFEVLCPCSECSTR